MVIQTGAVSEAAFAASHSRFQSFGVITQSKRSGIREFRSGAKATDGVNGAARGIAAGTVVAITTGVAVLAGDGVAEGRVVRVGVA
jgi:hypothetical protein